jgi:hypothetical protein
LLFRTLGNPLPPAKLLFTSFSWEAVSSPAFWFMDLRTWTCKTKKVHMLKIQIITTGQETPWILCKLEIIWTRKSSIQQNAHH